MKRIDMSGEIYNSWKVLYFLRNKKNSSYWMCKCICGKQKPVSRQNLKGNKSTSCGCAEKEKRRLNKIPFRKRIAQVHHAVMQRCYDSTQKRFKDYGGRGIKVCDQWHDLNCFYSWMIKMGYQEGLEINRINNDLGYSPENCNLVTRKENANNTRRTRYHEFFGSKITCSQLADKLNRPFHFVKYRIYRRNQTAEEIYTRHGNQLKA